MSGPRYSIADLLPRRTEQEWKQFLDDAERRRKRFERGLFLFFAFCIACIVTSYIIGP